MSLAYVIDDVFLGHRPPSTHPERPERLQAVSARLRDAGLENRGHRLPTRMADDTELGLVHTPGHVRDTSAIVPDNAGWLDGDTYYSPGTWRAALSAVGAVVDVTQSVLSGRHTRGLAVVRPPGHHAEADRAMGFCLFNNVAIAAASARAAGAGRVAVVDWDVHHGNGTQHIFYDDPSVMFLSCHQYPYYPGTGRASETGVGDGAGATVNVALPAGCGDREYIAVFDQVFVPALTRFRPDIVLVSAGFDAHASDPLADMNVTRDGYLAMATTLRRAADNLCDGRLVCALEGGYDLDGLSESVVALAGVLDGSGLAIPASDASGGRDDHASGGRDDHASERILPGARRAIEDTNACLARASRDASLAGGGEDG